MLGNDLILLQVTRLLILSRFQDFHLRKIAFRCNFLFQLLSRIIFFLLSASTNTKCYILRLPCKQTARFSIIRTNVAQQGSVLETFMFLSLQECQAKCLLNAECKSINYEVNGTQTCELNDKSTEDSQNDVTLNIRTGWNYYTTSYNDPLVSIKLQRSS